MLYIFDEAEAQASERREEERQDEMAQKEYDSA